MEKIISENKPNITKTSLNTYLNNIRITSRKIGVPLETTSDIVNNAEKIFEALNDLKTNTRKTKLASFIVAIDKGDKNSEAVNKVLLKFRNQMNKDLDVIKDKDTNQELTEGQKDNFIPWSEVLKVAKEVEAEAAPLLNVKTLTAKQFLKLTDYIIMLLYTEIAPRRSLDYTAFKINDIDRLKDNYMTGNRKFKLVFNQFKNASRLGSQEVDIPASLGKVLKKFIDKSPYDYLIVNKKGESVPQNYINKVLNRIFNKKIGSTMLRHIYLTEKFGNVDLKALEETTEAMGNSEVGRSLKYVSKDNVARATLLKK